MKDAGCSVATEELTTPTKPKAEDIMKRAMADTGSGQLNTFAGSPRFRKKAHSQRTPIPTLPSETTADHDVESDLPPIPEYLHTKYACQRPTPINPPNAAFIEVLKDIRTIRTLKGDAIGIRAYSTSIAALSAYPYTLSSSKGKICLSGLLKRC